MYTFFYVRSYFISVISWSVWVISGITYFCLAWTQIAYTTYRMREIRAPSKDVITAEHQVIRTKNYRKVIIIKNHRRVYGVQTEQTETMDCTRSGCPILNNNEYIKRHNKVCFHVHWEIRGALRVPYSSNTCNTTLYH